MPLVCSDAPEGSTEGGRISDGGTFNSLISDSADPSQSLLATCNHYNGGLIVTTIDIENPSVSQPFGDSKFPLLSNILDFHLSPYPNGFEIAGEGFELTINGEAQSLSVLTGAYERRAIVSNAQLEFSFESNVEGLFADWLIESPSNEPITGWDGEVLTETNNHVHLDSQSGSVNATFCVPDSVAELGCKIDSEWRIWLFLHDSSGHTRITNITLYTNDIDSDTSPPVAQIDLVQDEVYSQFVEFVEFVETPTGKKDSDGNWIMIQSPKYRVRLSETGTTEVKFSAANSTDIGTGIKEYSWTVSGDGETDFVTILPSGQTEWRYTFRNTTGQGTPVLIVLSVSDQRGQDSQPTFRMYFDVVGEMFGDEEPSVEMDSTTTADGQQFTSLDSVDIINITGTVVDNDRESNCDVTVEVALDDNSIFDLGESVKTTQKQLGRYDRSTGLCDGDTYLLSLNISHLYLEQEGNAGMVYLRISEGAYVIDDQIQLYTVPRPPEDPCVSDPASCEDSSGITLSGGVAIGVVAIVLILIVAITLMVKRRGGEITQDAVESFGGVEQMDPVEAYVQQLVAQGYEEQMARQYAQQYYAQYYAQQKDGNG